MPYDKPYSTKALVWARIRWHSNQSQTQGTRISRGHHVSLLIRDKREEKTVIETNLPPDLRTVIYASQHRLAKAKTVERGLKVAERGKRVIFSAPADTWRSRIALNVEYVYATVMVVWALLTAVTSVFFLLTSLPLQTLHTCATTSVRY
jgi:hypothetical protein